VEWLLIFRFHKGFSSYLYIPAFAWADQIHLLSVRAAITFNTWSAEGYIFTKQLGLEFALLLLQVLIVLIDTPELG